VRSNEIGRNTTINVVGATFPLVLSLATIPAYLHLIGEARYGVLAVIWVVLGYFGVFDLGLSRATANQIARARNEPPASRERVFWTAVIVNASFGAVGGFVLFFLGHVLLGHVVKAAPGLRSEAVDALPWLAVAVPVTTVTLVLAGTLEGLERFLTANSLTVVGLAMFQLAPLGYAYWIGNSLSGLIMAATLALIASVALSFAVTAMSLPVRGRPRIDRERLGALLRYGSWITVTGLVSPLLTILDRILIGAVLGATAVTRYTVPYALVSRAQILSSGLARTIFPRFSMLGRTDATHVARQSLRALAAVITPLAVIGAVALDPFLRVWVGDDIASSSAPVGEILLVGVWLNSVAVVPFAFLQAQGRPDVPAKFHLLELAPYIGALVLGLRLAEIEGAAWAWSGRAAVDALLLFWAARRASEGAPFAAWRELMYGGSLVAAASIASLTIFDAPSIRIVLGCALLLASTIWSWRSAPPQVREIFRRRLRRMPATSARG
jgi:O-antigen/teichoic acid export membrane protein